MTLKPDNLSAREAETARRWAESTDQVSKTAEAIRERQLSLANTTAAISERQERLKRRGLDLEAIVAEDDSVWVSFLSRGLAAARSVGRIVEPAGNGRPVKAVATGVLIAPGLLLSNNHVIPTADDAASLAVQLGYDYGDGGEELSYDTCRLQPDRCFWTDVELDFTVVAVADLDNRPPGEKYGVVPLIEQTGKALKAEILNVIHHPGGERKRLSIRENRLVATDELWLRYLSDTKHGSSGAPAFNDQWEMIALHHAGVPRLDAQGAQLNRAGHPWTPDMGEDAKDYVANEGARVSQIVKRLRNAPLEPAAKKLVSQALQMGTDQ